uniref:Gag polyprotein n=3 Tax=Nothobranchius korthausae TaxID=1143690 RepID=A0A1A8FYJ6_9TELE
MKCFWRSKKEPSASGEGTPIPVPIPGWETEEFRTIGDMLRQRGGRPGPWGEISGSVSPVSVLDRLTRIEVKEKAPLAGVRDMMWLFAEAWKKQELELSSCREQAAQEKIRAEEVEKSCSEFKQRVCVMGKELKHAQNVLDKTLAFVSRAQRKEKKRPRRTGPAQIRAFVKNVGEDWDPEKWNGDLWGDDEEEEWAIKPDPPPQPLYPSLQGIKMSEQRPITRRRREQQIIPPILVDMVDDQGRPVLDEAGNIRRMLQQQPQPAPRLLTTLEDYSQDELNHMNGKLKQRPGEPTDSWLNRLMEDGACDIAIDAGDAMRFSGLSTDAQINAEYRATVRALPVDEDFNVGDAYALACHVIYPTTADWPEIKGQWQTVRDAIQRLTRLTIREQVARNGGAGVVDGNISKATRDHLIRHAPPHYKPMVTSLLFGAADQTFATIKDRLGELTTLGDWSETRREGARTENKPRIDPRSGGRKGGAMGPSRTDLWRALRQAGVPFEEIDGLPTNALMEKCRQMGLKVHCLFRHCPERDDRMSVSELVEMLQNVIREVAPKPAEPSAPPKESSEEESSDDCCQVAAVKCKKKKQHRRERNDE